MKKQIFIIHLIAIIGLLSSCRHDVDIRLHSKQNPTNQTFAIGDRTFKRTDFVAELDLTDSTSRDFYLPVIFGVNYNFEIDWGDETVETFNKADHNGVTLITHTYANDVNKPIIRISGVLQGLAKQLPAPIPLPSELPLGEYIKEIKNMGDLDYRSLDALFENNKLLEEFSPLKNGAYANLSKVISLNTTFKGATSLKNVDIKALNLSQVKNFRGMFIGTISLISIDLSHMDLSSATNMSYMFWDATNLKSINLSQTKLQNVQLMNVMFGNTQSLEEIDLSDLDLSSVTTTRQMFNGATKLSSVKLRNLKLQNITNMSQMFALATSMVSIDFTGLNLSSVTNMAQMFQSNTSLISVNFNDLDLQNVSDMSNMFYQTDKLEVVDFRGTLHPATVNTSGMFFFSNVDIDFHCPGIPATVVTWGSLACEIIL